MTNKRKISEITVAGKQKQIIMIDANIPTELIVKTCAYVRVSSSSDEQYASYASQFNAYSQIIRDNHKLEFAGIYADEGITGTDADIRPEFQRMLSDCRKGKIDRIIAKSISRFARNSVDLLETVRELSKIGVSLYFEKENLDTAMMSSEMLLIVLSSLAESESISISQNQKWGINLRMRNGTYIQPSLPYGYEYNKQMQPVMIKSQAVIVKRIFNDYLSGKGTTLIAKELHHEMMEPPKSTMWNRSTVAYILSNSFYVGDVLWQKEYTTDTLPFKHVKNNGEKDQYIVENHHPAMIKRELFQSVQAVMLSRKVAYGKTPHMLSRKLHCPYCNRTLKRKLNKDGSAKWVCRTRFEKAENCRLPMLTEELIEQSICEMFQQLTAKMDRVLLPLLSDYREIARKTPNQGEVSSLYTEITKLNEQAITYAELKMQKIIPEEMYQQEVAKIQYQIKQFRDRIHKISADSIAYEKAESLESLIRFLTNDFVITDHTAPKMLEFIDTVHINMDETLTIQFKNTLCVTGGINR